MWSGVQATLNVAAPTFVSDVKKNYNPSQNSRDTNAIARRIEASSLPPSPLVQCWRYVFKF